ncbi:MAG: S8 family serine peptidase [Duganella sp.]
MKISFKLSVLAYALTAAAMVHAQSNSPLSNPFGNVAATADATLSKAAARAGLSSNALKKADATHLERLLDSTSEDFIVIFKDQAPARASVASTLSERLSLQKSAYQNTRARVRGELASSGLTFTHEYTTMPWAVARVSDREALVKLMNHPDVERVVENVKFKAFTTESLPSIHQPEAVVAGRNGAGTSVAIIDTGINVAHPAFGSCNGGAAPATCRVAALVAADSSGYKNGAHGTNVAGIAAAVAGGTKIVSLDVFPAVGDASAAAFLQAIDWTIANRDQYNIVAANMSLGADPANCSVANLSTAFSQAFTLLRNARISPVVATGNNGFTNAVSFPACVPGAIAVAANYDANYVGPLPWGNCTDVTPAANTVACFSNSSNLVTMFAPGVSVAAAGVVQSGTSQAAPHVAGAIAALRGANAAPNDSVNDTVARLLNSGVSVTDTRNGITKPRLDLAASLRGLIPDPEYRLVTQQVYLAYFGRAADYNGLASFAAALRNANAPKDVNGLDNAYSTNATVRSLIDSFGNSAESNALYGGNNTAFVTAIYQNLFNRAPDAAGLAFWVNALNNGSLTRGRAALNIMAASTGNSDGLTVAKKSAVAVNFTKSLDLAPEIAAYSGQNAVVKVRAMLAQVSSATDVNAFQSTIDSTISQLVAGQ